MQLNCTGWRASAKEATMTGFRSVLLSFLVAAGACASDPLSDDTDNLQGGRADKRDNAVGLVWIAAGGFCSGSLIAPDVVLTAGHCVESTVEGFYVGSGEPVSSFSGPPPGMRRFAVVDQVAHPGYVPDHYGCPNPTFDLALLHLDKKVSRVTPLALGTTVPQAGSTCTAVGFGAHLESSGATTYEAKRRGSEHFDGVTDTAIYASTRTARIDHGDSGGPLFCAGHLLGAASCLVLGTDDSVAYGRVDTARDWIDQALARWAK
jgi:hypothetical protein